MAKAPTDLRKDLGMTAEERKRLDEAVEAEAALIPDKPAPEPRPSFHEAVLAAAAKDGIENAEALGMGVTDIPTASGFVSARPASTKVRIADIIIGEDRREVSEEHVASLVASMAEVGQLQPISVTTEMRLVFGAHRIAAAKELGWEEIDAIVKSYSTMQADMAMIDENLVRNELSAMERAEAVSKRKALYVQLHPETKHGGNPGKAGGGKVARAAEVASFVDDTAKKTGMAARTIRQDAQIVKKLPKELRDRIRRSELAKNQSELLKLCRLKSQDEQREVAVMVLDGKAKNVDDAMRRRRLRLRHEEIAEKNAESAKLEAGEGPAVYGVILADVPWTYRRSLSSSREIGNQYDQMPTEEIADIPVADVAALDCVLFFWCPAAKIAEAVDIIRRWGFEVRSSMVWDKEVQGPGVWAMIEHELVIIAVKGSPPPPREGDKPRSVIHARREGHSEKPEALHLAIEKAWPTMTKLELFARERREGWKCLGNEIDGSDISVAIANVKARAGMKLMANEAPRADDLPSAAEPAQDSATAPAAPPPEPEAA